MTPKEQIIKASIEFSKGRSRIRCRNFEKGAEYGYNLALERVCEYLKFFINVPDEVETNENGEPLADSWIKAQMERAKAAEELIAEFRQAMKGGEK